MSKINLKLYFKKRKQRLSVFGLSPLIDWWFIVALGLILFFVGIGYASYLYINLNNGKLLDTLSEEVEDKTAQKKIKIEKTIKIIQEQNFDETDIN